MAHTTCRPVLGALILVVTASVARAETIHVKMEKLAFVPAEITAHVGDTIEWNNSDFVAHTATARDGSWDILIPAKTPNKCQNGRPTMQSSKSSKRA